MSVGVVSGLAAAQQQGHAIVTAVCAHCRGFTPFLRDDFIEWKREGRLVNDGVNIKVRSAVLRHALLARVACHAACECIKCTRPPFPLSRCLQLLDNHGPLDAREASHIFAAPAREWQRPLHASA